jgi:hypothetical protein
MPGSKFTPQGGRSMRVMGIFRTLAHLKSFRGRINAWKFYELGLLVPPSLAVPSAAQMERPLYPLYEVLANSKVSASMEFSGTCEPNAAFFPNPQAPPTVNGAALDVAREMFAGDARMKVTADADGTVRIKQRGIQDDILNVKIGRIKIGGDTPDTATYAPNLVLFAVMRAPEVAGFMKAHQMEWPPTLLFFEGSLIPPGFGFPHLSGSLENVTVSEVFDYALRTFPGIWLYKNCPAHHGNKRRIQFRFLKNPNVRFRRTPTGLTYDTKPN